jgi:hypothetical protein
MVVAQDIDLESLRDATRHQLEKTRQQLAQLERAYAALNPESDPKAGRYARLRIWMAVREYLREVGKASVTDILDALDRGGARLGKYPLRTVRIALNSPYMKNTFRIETVGNDDVVSLKGEGPPGRSHDGARAGPGSGSKRPQKA